MKLKFLTHLVGSNYEIKPGQVVDIEDEEALRHIANGNAEAVVTVAETATAPAAETTAAPKAETASPAVKETATTPKAKKAE